MLAKSTSLDAAAFEEAIITHKESLFRICRIYASAPLEPQDLFQEVVFQSWKSLSSFENRASVGTWLYRVALNVCMSTQLKLDRSNHKTVKLESIGFEIGQWQEEEDEKYEALRSCVAVLNESDRSLVVLYLEELSYREIGEVHGITENHVAVKMKRIRKKLFNCITKKLGK